MPAPLSLHLRGLLSSRNLLALGPAAFTALAGASLAVADPGPGWAETAFLTAVSALVLLAAAGIAPDHRRWPAAAVAATALIWVVPPGPQRGLAVAVVLALVTATALLRARPGAVAGIAGAIGLGALVEPGHLLPGDPDPWPLLLSAVGLGVGAALAGGRGAEPPTSHGAEGEAPGGAVALAVAAAVAAAGGLPGDLALFAVSSGIGWLVARSPRSVPGGLGGLALAGLLLWRPEVALVGLVTTAILALPTPAALAAAGVAVFLAAAFAPAMAPIGGLWPALAVVPAALLPGRAPWRHLLVAGATGIVAALLADPAIGAGLAALGLAVGLPAKDRLSRGWIVGAVVAVVVLGGYPWLRPEPLGTAARILGLPRAPLLAVASVGVIAVLGTLRRRPGLATVVAVAGGVLLVGGLRSLVPPSGEPTVLLDRTRVVGDEGETRSIDGGLLEEAVLITTLTNAAEIPTRAPVAVLEGLASDGTVHCRRILAMGVDTGEWAVRRPDLAPYLRLPDSAWSTWVAGGGDFFGQRYRTRWRPAESCSAVEVRLRRHPDLSPEVELVVSRLEVAP